MISGFVSAVLVLDGHELVEQGLKSVAVGVLLGVGRCLLTVPRRIGSDRDVVEFSILIQAETFFPDKIAPAVVDQHALPILAVFAEQIVGEVEAVHRLSQPDVGQGSDGRQNIDEAKKRRLIQIGSIALISAMEATAKLVKSMSYGIRRQ